MLQHFLAILVVVGIVIEDEINHRQSGQRSGAHMLKMRHAVHLDFDGNGNLLLHFFCGTAGPLGNYLHPCVGDVGIGFDGQRLECDCPPYKKQNHEAQDDETVVERKINELANHYCSTVFWNSSAFITTCWPGGTPEIISCMESGSMSPAITATRRN